VVDPGPDVDAHVRAVSSLLEGAEQVVILLTHEHGDHAGSAKRLAALTGCRVLGAGPVERILGDGETVTTDAGDLVALHTPGHVQGHLCFLWRERRALFAGDLVLGAGDTTWVAGYPGCVADYLESLERVRGLGLRRIYPAHGDPIDDVDARLVRFEAHRRARIAQVAALLRRRPGATRRDILETVYGSAVPPGLHAAALESVSAILDYLGDSERA
jgi:glyoxylase-like metal-dependent hydrolase (beta-lactamase superfamily II)